MERRRAKRPEVSNAPKLKRGRPSFTGLGSMKGISLRLPSDTIDRLGEWMTACGLKDRSAVIRDIVEAKLKAEGYG